MRRLLNSRATARHRALLGHAWRYYSVSLINTAFGYGTYALIVWAGVNLYVASTLSQLLGMTFNFFMFRAHVFKGSHASIPAYIGAYGLNYAVALCFLALFHHVTASPYLAGLLALVAASALNFFVLRFIVFRARGDAA